MRWRYLIEDRVSAAAGLACDEATMLPHGRDSAATAAAATLRLYTYRPHCALVGRYQSVDDEIELAACARLGVEVSRRPTGGGAILMGADQLGSVSIDLWLDTDANYPPTAADAIGTISISSDDHGSGTPSGSGFSTDQIPHSSWLFFYCDTATDIEVVTIALELI